MLYAGQMSAPQYPQRSNTILPLLFSLSYGTVLRTPIEEARTVVLPDWTALAGEGRAVVVFQHTYQIPHRVWRGAGGALANGGVEILRFVSTATE